MLDFERSIVIADIPGLIEGASLGRGMGIQFLKHVERTRILLHLIDFAKVDGRDPIESYTQLNQELHAYSKTLSERTQIIVATKMDVPAAQEELERFREKVQQEIYPISSVTGEGIEALLKRLGSLENEKTVS